MELSAEARLWWQGPECSAVEAWFEGLSDVGPGGPPLHDASGEGTRKDLYLRDPEQVELGIKVRRSGEPDERLEVKSLVDRRGEASPIGPVTIWSKSASEALRIGGAPTILTRKRRRLRKYGWDGAALAEIALDETEKPRDGGKPEAGCNVEFTRVTVEGLEEVWWTLGFEAFGKLGDIEGILRACIAQCLSAGPLPADGDSRPASYPEWLMRVAAKLLD